jgi:hypothetical protein
MNKKVIRGAILIVAIIVIAGVLFNSNQETNTNQETQDTVEIPPETVFIPEDIETAKSRQIQTLYDKVELEKLQDIRSEDLCEINFEEDEIFSDDLGKASFTFNESLIGEKVKISCDQFERFGISEDHLLIATITSTTGLTEDISCDYGSVTTPTVYFWFVSSNDLETDYCVAPLTVLPLEENEGECFDEETIQAMKDDCEDDGYPPYSIPDANGCETVYCGWAESQNLCTPESLVEEAEEQCEAEGNTAVRYSEEVSGQDFPCAQIRCSQCPSETDVETEQNNCEEKGGISETRTDHETGCSFIYCTAPEDQEEDEQQDDNEEQQDDNQEEQDDQGEDDENDGPPQP